jgi:hypothetical protein
MSLTILDLPGTVKLHLGLDQWSGGRKDSFTEPKNERKRDLRSNKVGHQRILKVEEAQGPEDGIFSR